MISDAPSQDDLLRWLKTDLNNWGRWGDDDERGTLNFLDDETTLRAMRLVREGAKVSCARPIGWDAAVDVPKPPQHYMIGSCDVYRPGEGPDRQVAIDYFGLVFHGHTVTHIDSLAHFFWDGQAYNGRSSAVVSVSEGATELDVTAACEGIITRGVLVDAPMLRGTECVERGDGVGLGDIKMAEEQCGFEVQAGDVLLMRTGQLGLREKRGPVDAYIGGSAGPKPEILPFLHHRNVAVMGSDTGNDVQPTPYERFSNPVHQVGIVGMGLWILDNAWLDDLAVACAQRQRWEFMISILPLRLPSVTGSPVNPIAIF